MNLVILKGNLARDPELRMVGGEKQTAVVNFSIAVNREFVRANGTLDKITSFISCEAWDSGAEAIAISLKKGDLVLVEGSLRNDSWEKDGVKHSNLKVRVNNFAPLAKAKAKNLASESEIPSEETVSF